MTPHRWSGVTFGALLVALVSGGALAAYADETASDEESQPHTQAPPAPVVTMTVTSPPPRPPAAADIAKLEQKLNEILQHQAQILQRLDQVMEELRIVKIRATVR